MTTERDRRIAQLERALDDGDPSVIVELDELRADRAEAYLSSPTDPRDDGPTARDRRVAAAASTMADALDSFMLEASAHLTCTEYEAVLGVMRALDYDVSGFAESDHVRQDEEDDDHYDPQYHADDAALGLSR